MAPAVLAEAFADTPPWLGERSLPGVRPGAATTAGAASAADEDDDALAEPVTLPAVGVLAQRESALERRLVANAKLRAAEIRRAEASELDRILNPDTRAGGAIALGAEGARERAAAAARRARALDLEAVLQVALSHTESEEERRQWRQSLQQLVALRREAR